MNSLTIPTLPRCSQTALTVLCAASCAISALAANWPAWRGPEQNGICSETKLPLRWSTNQNIRWSVPLPGPGNATPVIWGKRVFVPQSLAKEQRRTLMCFDRRDGKLLWQVGPTWTEKDGGGSANPPCSPSAVTDGKRVVAWFGSAGIFCWDMNGCELWHRDLGRQKHGWGYASSPVFYRDLCLLNFGPGERSLLVALDKRTGQTVWQRDLPTIGADAKWEDFGGDLNDWKKMGSPTMPEVTGSTSTPLAIHTKTGDEIVLTVPLRVMAFAPKNGEILWTCDGLNTGAYSSPIFDEGLVFADGSGLRNAAMAIRPGGRGDVTAARRLWYQNPPDSQACIGSGVIHQGRIYQMTAMGFAICRDLKTGQTIWDERLTGAGAKNSSWSSMVLAGDRLYVANQSADVFVLRASSKFECLATNSLGRAAMNASLAVSNGDIFVRTDRHLWCVTEKGGK